MEKTKVKFIKLNENAVVPTYGTQYSAGADLYASEECEIGAGKTVMVHTALAMEKNRTTIISSIKNSPDLDEPLARICVCKERTCNKKRSCAGKQGRRYRLGLPR